MSTKAAPLPNTSPKRAVTMEDLGLTPDEGEIFASGSRQLFGVPQSRNAQPTPQIEPEPLSAKPTGTPKPKPSPKPKAANEGALEKLAFQKRPAPGANQDSA